MKEIQVSTITCVKLCGKCEMAAKCVTGFASVHTVLSKYQPVVFFFDELVRHKIRS